VDEGQMGETLPVSQHGLCTVKCGQAAELQNGARFIGTDHWIERLSSSMAE
jgi:hypothetical protein